MTSMNLVEIQALAESLIVEHLPDAIFDGTSEWGFQWNTRISSLGYCSYKDKSIYLSARWCRTLPQEEIVDTILHEIAHAIAGGQAGHGIDWQIVASRIGAKPFATLSSDVEVDMNKVATSTHHMVDSTTGRVIKKYYRAPSSKVYRNISTYYVRGRKQETIGKLVIQEVPLIDKL